MILIPHDQHLVRKSDVGPLIHLIKSLPLGLVLAVDTETNGLHPYEGDTLMGVSFAWQWQTVPRSFYVPVNHPSGGNRDPQDVQDIFTALMDRCPNIIMHNGLFDLPFLQQLPRSKHGGPFFSVHDWVYDTMVVAWLHDENMKHGLKEQAAHWWGDDEKEEQTKLKALISERGGWGNLTPEDIADYAAKDAEQTFRLWQRQLQNPPVYGDVPHLAREREMKVQHMLYRMMQTGIKVDPELLEKQLFVAEQRVREIEEHFNPNGLAKLPKNIDEFEYEIPEDGVNINSPKQLAYFLFDGLGLPCLHKTNTGARSVARQALEELENMATPEQAEDLKLILEHRRLAKAVGTYYIPIADRIALDGRVHPFFKSCVTVTGRFSCVSPNLQTIPRADTLVGVRDIFIPEEGFELWEYDLSAAELRVMAGWANDERMIGQLNEGRDMHSENAAEIFGPDFTPLQRRTAKNIFYGWCYEIGAKKAAQYMVQGEPVTDEHVAAAAAVLRGYNRLYPKIAKLKKHFAAWAKREKFIALHVPGRYRRFHSPGVTVPYYTALNACVQGGIGEAMKDCMLAVEAPLDALGARMCLQVHDSLVIEVPIGAGGLVQAALQSVMDAIQPFPLPMIWDAAPWTEHD